MLSRHDLDNLSRLAKGLAAQFGSDCEILVHDLTDQSLEHSIVAIENGHISGRKIGDGPSPVVLELLAGNEIPEDRLCYFTKTPDGKVLKSSTVFIKDRFGKPDAVFSINFDISRLSIVSGAINEIISISPGENAEPPRIAQNVNDLLDELIESSVQLVGKPVSLMSKNDKVNAIRYLNRKGALLITKSGDKIAKYFGISKYTLYSYLDDKQEEN